MAPGHADARWHPSPMQATQRAAPGTLHSTERRLSLCHPILASGSPGGASDLPSLFSAPSALGDCASFSAGPRLLVQASKDHQSGVFHLFVIATQWALVCKKGRCPEQDVIIHRQEPQSPAKRNVGSGASIDEMRLQLFFSFNPGTRIEKSSMFETRVCRVPARMNGRMIDISRRDNNVGSLHAHEQNTGGLPVEHARASGGNWRGRRGSAN